MGSRPNYGFQKRQKEIEKQKKKDEKAAKKQARKDAASDTASDTVGQGGGEDGARSGGEAGGGEANGEADEESDRTVPGPVAGLAALDPALQLRLNALCEEGWDIWSRFDAEVRQRAFHPFVAADYPVVLEALIALRAPGRRFLEWGSASGVITIMADLLGYEAYGIEIDPALVDQARELAARMGSAATFTAASFLPAGYLWKGGGGEGRTGTIAEGDSGYLQLGKPLEDFDVVFAYPWMGEEAMMLDLMKVHGGRDAHFLVHTEHEVRVFRGGRLVPAVPAAVPVGTIGTGPTSATTTPVYDPVSGAISPI